jgi:Recombinase
MSLSRKQRRKRDRRRYHETQHPTRAPHADWRSAYEGSVSSRWAVSAPGGLEGVDGTARSAPTEQVRVVDQASTASTSLSRAPQEADEVRRLAYTRRQAAEALGVSISTIDRRVVPAIDTFKLPWGQRLIPADELERFMRNHVAPARSRPAARVAGRPPTLPPSVVERICLEYARGLGLSDIARTLTDEGVATAHGGRTWWPSSVRAVLVRSRRTQETDAVE